MGGGLMQLVAYGAQDIYLTGNPQITFFKVVYRRHTNFSMEAIEQTWNGSTGSGTPTAGRCTATISRNGDLIHNMYIEVQAVAHATANTKNITSQSITNVELEIGGQRIDKHSGQFMETWAELTEPNTSLKAGLVGGAIRSIGTPFQLMSGMGGTSVHDDGVASIFNIPLYFWFCKNPGLALPLIALQYHEVKVILDHNFSNGFASGLTQKLWVDYIYLDTDERRRFAQQSHEYLIEQVQEQSLSTPGGSNDLNFNHPVKELIWNKFTSGAPDTLLSGTGDTLVTTDTYQLKLNGHDRFAARHVSYFTNVQVHKHHSGCGGIGVPTGANILLNTAAAALTSLNGIAVYSFALKPEEHQPSGTCNFSRIDNAQLVGGSTCVADTCYAINYNVLRIMSGMGGLAYSN